jgi:regulator of protease activity HflC (stomatin/prohibitin superfamily)
LGTADSQSSAGRCSNIKLGVEILQFDVLSIHPPIEVADSFLEIVTARIDAEREIAEARGAYLTENAIAAK